MPDLDRIHIVIENLPDARAQVSVNIHTPHPGMHLATPAHVLAIDALGWMGKHPAVAGFVYAPSLNIKCDDEQTLLAAYGTLQALGCHAASAAVLRAMDAPGLKLTAAAHDVLKERARQVAQEGYDTEHDDSHVNDEIAAMAALLVMPEAARDWDTSSTGYGRTLGEAILPPDWNYPRLGDRRDQLVKGAAMALAEIERIDRAAQPSKGAAA